MLEWVIVGAGLHGSYLARVLLKSGVSHQQLRIIDPHTEPMTQWYRQTAATGMRYLRSPAAHHLGDGARELIHYAGPQPKSSLLGYYRRPALSLFNAHSRDVVADSGLTRCLLRDRVVSVERSVRGYHVHGREGSLHTRRVLLAVGQPPPQRPAWAQRAGRVQHVFDPEFTAESGIDTHATIIGGGLSAIQVALSWVNAGNAATLLSRHPLQVAAFDADPCYLGPRCLRAFHAETRPEKRRQLVELARHPGTLPATTLHRLAAASDSGRLNQIMGEVVTCENGTLGLLDGRQLQANRIILATGFDNGPPGGNWVAGMAEELQLPRAPDGFPIVSQSLEWAPGLFIGGRLAELELGPAAGNIAGARMAGRRLLKYCRTEH